MEETRARDIPQHRAEGPRGFCARVTVDVRSPSEPQATDSELEVVSPVGFNPRDPMGMNALKGPSSPRNVASPTMFAQIPRFAQDHSLNISTSHDAQPSDSLRSPQSGRKRGRGPGRSPLPRKCEYCGRVFSKGSNLKRHVNSVHFGYKRFNCSLCSLMFADRCSVDKHVMKAHNTCYICCMDCQDRRNLVRHIQDAHQGELWVCTHWPCMQVYRSERAWSNHERSHKTRVCYCPVKKCGRSFHSKSNLRRHMKGHAPEDIQKYANVLEVGSPIMPQRARSRESYLPNNSPPVRSNSVTTHTRFNATTNINNNSNNNNNINNSNNNYNNNINNTEVRSYSGTLSSDTTVQYVNRGGTTGQLIQPPTKLRNARYAAQLEYQSRMSSYNSQSTTSTTSTNTVRNLDTASDEKVRWDMAFLRDTADETEARFDSPRYDSARIDSARVDSTRIDSTRIDSARVDSSRFDSNRDGVERRVQSARVHSPDDGSMTSDNPPHLSLNATMERKHTGPPSFANDDLAKIPSFPWAEGGGSRGPSRRGSYDDLRRGRHSPFSFDHGGMPSRQNNDLETNVGVFEPLPENDSAQGSTSLFGGEHVEVGPHGMQELWQ